MMLRRWMLSIGSSHVDQAAFPLHWLCSRVVRRRKLSQLILRQLSPRKSQLSLRRLMSSWRKFSLRRLMLDPIMMRISVSGGGWKIRPPPGRNPLLRHRMLT